MHSWCTAMKPTKCIISAHASPLSVALISKGALERNMKLNLPRASTTHPYNSDDSVRLCCVRILLANERNTEILAARNEKGIRWLVSACKHLHFSPSENPINAFYKNIRANNNNNVYEWRIVRNCKVYIALLCVVHATKFRNSTPAADSNPFEQQQIERHLIRVGQGRSGGREKKIPSLRHFVTHPP